ncbi:hypothetical protein LBMAG42_01980 [Deltaproteobacteria bacterium]|nr:hypothetical protein LBMAG42_01980 [Deltaproteobacteria bacterium]
MRRSHPANAAGDWYVEDECCLTCAVPVTIAPTLFRWVRSAGVDGTDTESCVVARQPNTEAEVDQMVEVAYFAEVECVRYKGMAERVRAKLRNRASHAMDIPDPD